MSKINSRSKSSLFLMEIIIVICFFALSAAICMKVFASAKVKTDLSRDMTNASYAAESLAETFKAGKLQEVYPDATNYDNIFTVYYDDNWEMCKEYSGTYKATMTSHTEKNVEMANIVVYAENGDTLFEIVAAKNVIQGVE